MKKTSFFSLLLLPILLISQHVAADVVLPDIEEKYVTIQSIDPTRDAGYVVGDTLERTITFTLQKPYELVTESLPIVGYEHRWKGQVSGIELTQMEHASKATSNAMSHTLHLKYQVFTTGRTAKPAALRSEILKARNTQTKEVVQVRLPIFTFRVSPMSVIGQIKLNEELSPFVPPLLLDSNREKLQLNLSIGALALSLLGLLYIWGVNTWLPKMGGAFAKAYRDILRQPNNEEGIRYAVARLHQALNATHGNSLFRNGIANFSQKHPAFVVLQPELEKFFVLSDAAFFDEADTANAESSMRWLAQFARHCRDCERGLRPEVSA